MTRRTLLAECQRLAPGYDWTQREGFRPSAEHPRATISASLLWQDRRGKTAMWGVDAVLRPAEDDHDAGGPTRAARGYAASLTDAIASAVAALDAKAAQ